MVWLQIRQRAEIEPPPARSRRAKARRGRSDISRQGAGAIIHRARHARHCWPALRASASCVRRRAIGRQAAVKGIGHGLHARPMPMSPAPCSRIASSKPMKEHVGQRLGGGIHAGRLQPLQHQPAMQAPPGRSARRWCREHSGRGRNTGSRARATNCAYSRAANSLRAADFRKQIQHELRLIWPVSGPAGLATAGGGG